MTARFGPHPSPTAIFHNVRQLHGFASFSLKFGTLAGTFRGRMARKKPKKSVPVPAARVRRHGSGFRGVATVLGRRAYGPTYRTIEEAEAWLATIDVTDPRQTGPLTLKDGLTLLLRDLADSGGADGTIAFYRRAHLELAAVLGEDTRLDMIDERAVRFYLDRRKRDGIALQTIVRKELGTLRRIIRLAIAAGRLGRDPMAKVRMPKVRGGRFESIDAAVVDKAIADIRAENVDHADIVELIWRTSMRRAEVARLTVADVDLQARKLFVRGKTVDRYRPIGDRLAPVLERMVARAGPDGRLVSSMRKIEKLFAWWRDKLGLPVFSPHVLRHGFASDLLNQGVAASVVASLMGHSGVRMMDRYFHAQDAALLAAVDALGKGKPRPPTPPSGASDRGRPGRGS